MGLAILALLILAFCVLGVVASIYLLVVIFMKLFAPKPKSRTQKTVTILPNPTREKDLAMVSREIDRAFQMGRLGIQGRNEMQAYIKNVRADEQHKKELDRVLTKAGTERQPAPTPPSSPPPKPSQRDPAEIRSAIARLHKHAQEPVPTHVPEDTTAPDTRVGVAATGSGHQACDKPAPPGCCEEPVPLAEHPITFSQCSPRTSGTGCANDRTASGTDPKKPPLPAHAPSASALSHGGERATPETARFVVATTPQDRTLAERLFTPENVRILQSLGIGLIFFSAVAYVRTQMWENASALTQMTLLLGGTGACLGLGFALRRWTSLRITGLGFLILGHLSMILDAYAALVPTGPGAAALYQFQPGSLWTVTLAIFTASAFWHARALKEPLFDAFTVFGAFATWAAAAHWMGACPWHLAAVFAPPLLGCRLLYPVFLSPDAPMRRWGLAWWLHAAWELGAPLLVLIELACALLIGPGLLREDLWLHLGALSLLGVGMLWDACVSTRKQLAHFGSLALLAVCPMLAFAHGWVLDGYLPALAIPAAGLTLAALAWSKWVREESDEASEVVGGWGLVSVIVAASAAVMFRLMDPSAAVPAAWTAGALTAVGAALVVLRRSVPGMWLAMIGLSMLSAMLLDLTDVGLQWIPHLWLLLAALVVIVSAQNGGTRLASTARLQSDLLTLGAWCGSLSFGWGFWATGIETAVRFECAVFYGLLLIHSVLTGIRLRSPWSPVFGGCAVLALSACAFGGWQIPYETYGLPVMLVTVGLLSLGWWMRRRGLPGREGQILASHITGGVTAVFAACFLLLVLALGPKGGLHAASVSAWLLAALALWYTGRGAWPGLCGFGCSMSLFLAGLHALRWNAIEFTAFGPAIGAFALALLAAREVVEFFDVPKETKPIALHGRAGGFVTAAFCSMLLAGLFGLAGYLDGKSWHWVTMLAEGALFLGALSVLARRRSDHAPAPLLLLAESGMWLLLGVALVFAADAGGYSYLLHGAPWALIGALALLFGMMLEMAAGAVIGPSAQARAPGAFLESRHLAAAACAGAALLTAMAGTWSGAWIDGVWQTCAAVALLAIYGSLSRPSVSKEKTRIARYASALTAYTVLLPLGYLAFLKSQSTGSSWGAVWFMALAPVLLGVAWLLEREREPDQSTLAKFGALLVSGGALVMAFATNREALAEVPAWTFFLLMLQALLMRRWHGRKEWTVAALAALSGTIFFAIRALRGDPAWGLEEAWAWEGICMVAVGLVLTVTGGHFRWELNSRKHSLVGGLGVVLSALSLGLMLFSLILHGTSAGYLANENTARLDAFNVGLILNAGVALAAWRWLGFSLGRWLAPAQVLLAYGLTLWAWHVSAWEYYTLPAALASFLWAWQSERIDKNRNSVATRTWQALGSALLLIPSFVQSLPYTDTSVFHFFVLAAVALLLVGGAMWTRRKIPLLAASSALLLCTIIKTAQWAAHREVILPVAGIGLGFAVLAVGSLFESRMNRALRTAADQVRAQAKMFWTNWD